MEYGFKIFLLGIFLLWGFPSSRGDVLKAESKISAIQSNSALRQLLRTAAMLQQHPDFRQDVDHSQRKDDMNLTELCRNHINFQKLSFMQDWALRMADSSTSLPPEGLMEGALVHLGNFDECINIRDIKWVKSVFHGQHCLASVSYRNKSSSSLRVAYDKDAVSQTSGAMKIAKCLPSSCNTEDTEAIVKNDLKVLENQIAFLGKEFVVQVNVLECHTADKPELKTEDWITVGVFCFFGVLVLLSTCYDVLKRKSESRNSLLLAFSVYTNGKKLLATSSSGDTLHCLHGIRFLSMAWVVLGHRYYAGMVEPSINIATYLNDIVTSWKYLFISNATLSVDTFFLLSGLLVAYVFFRQVPKTNSFNVPLYYLHRYIRLTPAFSMVMLFAATLWRYTGSGPLWDSSSTAAAQACQDNWWAHILYVQNYVKPEKMCVGQSWYLAVDMQLFWLSPLVLVPLWKWPKIGWTLLAAIMVGGAVSNFVISYVNDYLGSFMKMMVNGQAGSYSLHMYFPAYTRFNPYLIGIALGYLLVDLKSKGRKIQFSKVVTLLLWLVAAGIMLLTLCIVHVYQQPDYEFEPVAASLYQALGRPGWALGIALVIFLCATGHGGFANTFLSWEWFQPLSRISYSVFLVHMSFQSAQYYSLRTPVYLDDTLMFHQFFGDLMISLFFATIVCLVFESPFMILERELLGGKKKPPKPIVEENRSPNEHNPGEGQEKKEAV